MEYNYYSHIFHIKINECQYFTLEKACAIRTNLKDSSECNPPRTDSLHDGCEISISIVHCTCSTNNHGT